MANNYFSTWTIKCTENSDKISHNTHSQPKSSQDTAYEWKRCYYLLAITSKTPFNFQVIEMETLWSRVIVFNRRTSYAYSPHWPWMTSISMDQRTMTPFSVVFVLDHFYRSRFAKRVIDGPMAKGVFIWEWKFCRQRGEIHGKWQK